jgi:hypothetical protein
MGREIRAAAVAGKDQNTTARGEKNLHMAARFRDGDTVDATPKENRTRAGSSVEGTENELVAARLWENGNANPSARKNSPKPGRRWWKTLARGGTPAGENGSENRKKNRESARRHLFGRKPNCRLRRGAGEREDEP